MTTPRRPREPQPFRADTLPTPAQGCKELEHPDSPFYKHDADDPTRIVPNRDRTQ